MNEENITITKKEYYELKSAEAELNLLNMGGVNNWEWYGESLSPDFPDEDNPGLDALLDKIHLEIFGIERGKL